jgi:hypothetical protein
MTYNSIHTVTRGGNICFQTIVFYGCIFASSYMNTLRMSCFCTTFGGQTRRVLRVIVCLASTTVTSEQETILMLLGNVGIKFSSELAFELILSVTLSWPVGPWLLPDSLTAQRQRDFLETVLPGLVEVVPLTVRHRLWFQHDGAPVHLGKMSDIGWTRLVQEDRLDMERWIHSLLGRRIWIGFFLWWYIEVPCGGRD